MSSGRFAATLAALAALALPASAEAAGYHDAVLSNDPLTYLQLDEPVGATVAQDASPYDRDGVYGGGVALGVGAPFVDAGTAGGLAGDGTVTAGVGEVSRTVEIWINPNRVVRGKQAGIVSHGDPAADGWAVGIGAKRKLTIVTGGATVPTKITLANGVWTLVTITWSDKVRVYLNGVLKKAFNGGPASAGGALVLGGNGAGAFTGAFTGKLDEAALYRDALSAAAIYLHFSAAHVPAVTTPPSITGSPAVGATLTVVPGVWADAATATRAYQWQRCDADGNDCEDVDGATGTTYVLGAQDDCMTLQVAETVTNASGAGTTISDPTGVVGPCGQPDPTPDPDPTPGSGDGSGVAGSGSGIATGTGATVGTTASVSSGGAGTEVAGATISAGCLRLVAGPKRKKLRRYGILRIKATKNTCLSAPISAKVKPRKGTRLKSVRYKLDGKRVKRAKKLKFGVQLRPAKLTPGKHMLKLRVKPRAGKAKTFKVRLRLAVA